ncbi:MAG: F0F1 ATP synthase subunit B [Chloroflexi bacterium]|nr:F0F1 ATP synthase subunit B [Chloroflexota bacterium]
MGILEFEVPIFGPMGVNLPGLIGQIVNFLILLFVLRLVLYKPVLQMLDQRSARIREGVEQAERARAEAIRMQQEYEARMEEARRENQRIINEAMQISDRLRAEAQEQARQQAEQFLERARAEIEQDRRQAAAELRGQVADIAIAAASKVVRRSLDAKAHAQIIDEVLSEADKLKYN